MSEFSDWRDDQYKVGFFAGALFATAGTNAFLRRYAVTKVTLAGWVLGAYVATQAVGYVSAGAIDGKRGIDNWYSASHTMFRNRTILDKVPVVGSALTVIPNPLGIVEVLWDAGVKLGEYTNPFVGKTFEISDGSW